MPIKYCFYTVFLLLSSPLFSQNTHFVNQSIAGGLQDGSSWQNAFPNLNSALNMANYGDEIWVATGTYYPMASIDRGISFELKNGVKLLGGFQGTETLATQRDPAANPTRLSGNIGDPATQTDNSYHVLRGRGLDENTLLDGFIISDGYSLGGTNMSADPFGAGLFLVGSSIVANTRPQISNCVFEHNGAGDSGGAIFIGLLDPDDPFQAEYKANAVLKNCVFYQNQAYIYGGAVVKEGPTGASDSFLVEDCRFDSNYVFAYDGGGLFFSKALESRIVLRRCSFENNIVIGGTGGGFCVLTYAPGGYTIDIDLEGCTFKKNTAPEGGGFSYDGQTFPQPDVTLNLRIKDCIFEENTSRNSFGAAFHVPTSNNHNTFAKILNCKLIKNNSLGYFTSSLIAYGESALDVLLQDCLFVGNKDFESPASYCAAFSAGGNKVNTRINNCTFADNANALFAGGSEQAQVFTQITNCTFFSNGTQPFGKRWYPSFNQPGAVYYNKMYFYNCAIWETEVETYLFYNNYEAIANGSWFFLDYCSFHPLIPATIANHTEVLGDSIFVGLYPEFVDTLAGDFHLKTCSPAKDRGLDQAALDAGLSTDLDGLPRYRYSKVDLGAYEVQDSCFSIGSQEPISPAFLGYLWPNPVGAGGTLQVEWPGSTSQRVQWAFWDAYGRKLERGISAPFANKTLVLKAPDTPGLYFLEMQAGAERVCLKAVVR